MTDEGSGETAKLRVNNVATGVYRGILITLAVLLMAGATDIGSGCCGFLRRVGARCERRLTRNDVDSSQQTMVPSQSPRSCAREVPGVLAADGTTGAVGALRLAVKRARVTRFRLAPPESKAIPAVTRARRISFRSARPTSMSRAKDFLIGGLALCSGALSIVVWRQHAELRQLAQANSSETGKTASTMSVRVAANRSFVIAPRPAAPARAGDATRNQDVMDDAGAERFAEAPRKPARRGGSALARLMDNPEFVEALTLQRHALLDVRFGELFRRLNLEGDELAAFKRLLAEKENVALDVVTVSETSPEGPLSAESLRASVRAAQSQIEQAILSSLGSDRYAVYREYERTVAHRATVSQLEQRLSYTRTPLTPAQADAVVRILASNTAPGAESPAPPASVVVRAGVPEAVPLLPTSASTGRVTDEVVTQVQAVLTPPQLEALKEIQGEQQAAVKAAQMIRDVAPAATEILPTWPTLLMH